MPARFERADHIGHRAQVLLVGGARVLFDLFQTERGRVLAEGGMNPALGVLAQRHAGLLRFDDGLIVDVGEVDDVAHVVAELVLQDATQDVDGRRRCGSCRCDRERRR